MPTGPPPTTKPRPKPKPKPKTDRDRDRRDETGGTEVTAGEMTSATTTAPEPESGAGEEEDMGAFFSSGHGPAMHYDRGSQAGDNETGETSGT